VNNFHETTYSSLSPVHNLIDDILRWSAGQLWIQRRGLTRPQYLVYQQATVIAALSWQRTRQGIYETEQEHFTLQVGSMGKVIYLKDEQSNVSRLTNRSITNPLQHSLLVQLADSDTFNVGQRWDRRQHTLQLEVIKQHYVSSPLTLNYYFRQTPSRLVAEVHLGQLMRREALNFHPLMGLLLARIALAREQ
jgi:hypothetical protein